MDFKSRLNSCGKFGTDENFKKIILRNSCRLREKSALSHQKIPNNKELKEINNIKLYKKKSESQNKELEKTEKEKIEKIILLKNTIKKNKKYYRHISITINKDNNNNDKPTSSNILFFYQDIRALKLCKNNLQSNIISFNDSSEDIKAIKLCKNKKMENKINSFNDSLEDKYSSSLKKIKLKKNCKDDKKEEDNSKSNTIYNNSLNKRKQFLLKRIKHKKDNNLITNEIKLKKNLFNKEMNNTTLLDSSYILNNSSINELYSTEINNNPKKNFNHNITKENFKLYKKPQKIYHERNKYTHNSISLFPTDIKIKEVFNDKKKNEEAKEKEIIINDIKDLNNSVQYNLSGKNDDFINNFFCELIDLSNGMEEKSLFDILVNNLNKKYIYNYKSKSFPISNIDFIYCFRYFCLLITPLLFLSKDYDLYKYDSVKGRLLINQYIYSSLSYIGKNNFDIPKINNFIKKYSGSKKVHIKNSTNSFIKLIFGEKEEYEPLKGALIQLIKNILNETVDNIIKILNNTILFCFNNKPVEKLYYPFYKKKNQNQTQIEENSKISESAPSAPFIKSSMKKEFCLVLDIDETISHSIKLSYGYYFLLRPGTIEFLTELSNYYEIDIFTSSLKLYADFIIDKIDINGDLISYRLYKNHVTYEKGKSIKNLNMIGRDLNKIIFVDNLKSNAKYNLKNLCHISTWINDVYDDELIKLKNKLKFIATSGKYNDDITKGIN